MNIVIDIETTGLKINDQINYVGLYYKENENSIFKSFKLPDDSIELYNELSTLENQNAKFIGHNIKFDTVRLLFNYNIDIKIAHDTMIMAYVMSTVDELKDNQKKWLGLKYVAKRILNVDDWNIDTKKKTSTSDEDVLPYLKKDCEYTYSLFEHFLKAMPKEKRKTYKLIIHALNAYKYAEVNGLPIDLDLLKEVEEEYRFESQQLDIQLAEKLGGKEINFSSSVQLSKYLFEDLHLPVVGLTDKGNPSTGVDELKKLKDMHPIIPMLLKKREIDKALVFLESWKDNMIKHDDGYWYLHSNFNMHGTVTGRTSSNDVNLQQIPRNKKLKSIFRSRNPEWELVQMDYSQLELRFAGIVANVSKMKESYRQGKDLHYEMASQVTGKPINQITKVERTQAKAANFGFLYGMQAKSFVEYALATYGVTVTQEEAILIRENFFQMYPELETYYADVHNNIIDNGYHTSIMGRQYQINPDKLLGNEKWAYLRAAINFPVQSAGSDYVISGLIELSLLPENRDGIKVCATVHDSIIALVKKDNLFEERVNKMKMIMQKPLLIKSLCSKDIDIPIIVDDEIGPLGLGVSLKEYMEGKTHE